MPTSRADASAGLLDQMAALGRRNRNASALVAHAHGLQPAHVQLLFALHRAQECRVAGLADTQLVDPSVVSRQAGALEKLGLVARRPDPEDGRAALLSLTEAGRERLRRVRETHLGVLTESLGDWDVARIERLAADLAALAAAADAVYASLLNETEASA